jgi:hypothetical protein
MRTNAPRRRMRAQIVMSAGGVDLGEAECNGHYHENEDEQLQSTSAGNLDEPRRSEIPKVATDPR